MKLKLVLCFLMIVLLTTNVCAFSLKETLTSFSIKDFFNRLFGVEKEVIGINIEGDESEDILEEAMKIKTPPEDISDEVIEQPILDTEEEIKQPERIDIITQEPIIIQEESLEEENEVVAVPNIYGYLSVATLKQSYNINEQINLTDPPQEEGFFSKLIEGIKNLFKKGKIKKEITEIKKDSIFRNVETREGFGSQIDFIEEGKNFDNFVYGNWTNYSKPVFKGYIVKYKEKSVGERRVELINKKEKNIDQNLLNYKFELENKHQEHDNILSSRISNYNNKKNFDYYLAFNGISLNTNSYEVSKIKDLNFIESISPNYQVKALLRDSVPIINADDVWNLGYTGEGVKIAIIDTGIDYTHEDLGGCFGIGCRIEGGHNFIDENAILYYYGPEVLAYFQSIGANLDPEDPMDDMGHGTHCAGIAAGNGTAGDGLPIKGVAPNATLYGYKVLDAWGYGYTSIILASFEYVLDPNQDGNMDDRLDIVSMSLGGTGNPDDVKSLAVDNMVNNGVVTVVSAGNSGSHGYNTIGSPGTSRKAITVGASTKDDEIADYSSNGPTVLWTVKPDVVAPGGSGNVDEKICATRWPEFYGGYLCIDDYHIALDGTSMAAPHVAGAAALIKEANPDWTPDEIKYALRNTAIDLGENILTQGYGRIDVLDAVSSERPLILEFNKTFENEDLVDFSAIIKVNSDELYDNYNVEFNLGYMGERFINYPFTELQDPTEWLSEFYFEDSITINNNEPFIVDLPLINKRDINTEGIYLIKIDVKNINGEIISQDAYTLSIENTKILYPVTSDVYGNYFEFFGSINLTDLDRYTLEYSSDNINWNSEGITLTNNGMQSINNDVLGEFNSPIGFEKGIYLFRVHVYLNGGGEQTKLIGSIYIDPTIRDGFPKSVPFIRYYPPLFENFILDPSYITPVIEDINNDGQKEIIIFAADNSYDLNRGGLIYIYDNNMDLINKFSIEESYYLPNRKSLSVGDINGDGQKEIIVIAVHSSLDVGSIFVYSINGEMISSRDLDYYHSTSNLQSHLVISDLNLDNRDEIIFYVRNESYIGKLDVLDNNLLSLDGWPKDYIGNAYEVWTNGFRFLLSPAIGNFDGDDEKEIIIAYNNYSFNSTATTNIVIVSIFDVDGSLVNSWEILNPSWTGGSFYTLVSSSPVVGDINNDGMDDIVVETSSPRKTYVFNRYGEILEGWPQEGSEIIFAAFDWQNSKAPSLAKIDNNFIIVAMDRVYNADGSLIVDLGKEPLVTDWDYCAHTYSDVIADVDNDGELEVICTQFINTSTFYIIEPEFNVPWDPLNSEFTLVHAKNLDGTNVVGFPKFIPGSRPLNSNNIVDLDGDGMLELVSTSSGFNVFLSPYFFNGYGPQYPAEIEGRSSIYIWDLDTNIEGDLEWPTAHHDMNRTGRYGPPPTSPDYILTANPTYGVAPLTVSFSLRGDFIPGTQFTWYFGDETITNSLTSIEHTYEEDGNYNVNVKIMEPGNLPVFSNIITIIVLPKSKIQNTGSAIIQGYLLMKVQKNVDNEWQDYEIIIDDLYTNTLRTIEGNSYLALDEIWNENNVVINEIGDYRIYAALLDINGNVISTSQGDLEDIYEFNISISPYVTPIGEGEVT